VVASLFDEEAVASRNDKHISKNIAGLNRFTATSG
jgi:hypothetical protein